MCVLNEKKRSGSEGDNERKERKNERQGKGEGGSE